MKIRSAVAVALPVTLVLTLWGATAMSVTPSNPPPATTTPPSAQPGGGSAGQIATIDQRRISALEDQVKALQNEVNALKGRMAQAENNIRPLQSHTHTYEVENLGGMNLATIQAHPNNVLIATKPNSQQGGPTITKTSSGPKN